MRSDKIILLRIGAPDTGESLLAAGRRRVNQQALLARVSTSRKDFFPRGCAKSHAMLDTSAQLSAEVTQPIGAIFWVLRKGATLRECKRVTMTASAAPPFRPFPTPPPSPPPVSKVRSLPARCSPDLESSSCTMRSRPIGRSVGVSFPLRPSVRPSLRRRPPSNASN